MNSFQKQLFLSGLLALILTAYSYAGGGHDHDHAHEEDHPTSHEDHDDHEEHEDHSDHDDHSGHGDHDEHEGHDDHDDGPEPVVVTQYTDTSELFMEHPPLVRGESAELIIHLTRLSDFTPITKGSLEVRLLPQSGQAYTLIAEQPARAGLYLPEIEPPFSGSATMELILRSPQMNAVHRMENVTVYASAEEIPHAHHEEASGDEIAFSKEQQWRIDFATVPVDAGNVSNSVQAYGRLRLPTSGRAILPAPTEGLVSFVSDPTALEIGQHFKKGAPLFHITPDANWSAGLTNLYEEYELANLELERMKKLFKEEAVAERRVEEATIKLRTLAQALERMGLDLENTEWENIQAVARAPIHGVLAEVHVLSGQRVTAGQALAVIEDESSMVLEATVPVTRIENFRRTTDAIFHLSHGEKTYRISEMGGAAISRSPLPADQPGFARFLFQFKNKEGLFLHGTKASVHLLSENSETGVVIPVDALNEEQGQPLVYVHTAGETVEKRFPRLGASDGRNVLVLSGIEPGERVVTRGATAIRLSSLSTTEMGHGHAH